MQLIKKIFIDGKIELKTGLHIGGSSTALDIGGIDASVIKNAKGIPYIPGSSIKGKMRSLMEMKYSSYTQRTGEVDSGMQASNDSNPVIQKLFGSVAGKSDYKTRLIVRDAYLSDSTKSQMENKSGDFEKLELDYTEGKWENSINRLTSTANPRQLERVPSGAIFDFSFVFTFYQEDDNELLKMFIESMQLLEDDYLGGSGSRGYGQITFNDISISQKTAKDYREHNPASQIITGTTLDNLNVTNFIS